MGQRMLGLLLACHPLPCLAVTGFATAYAWVLGADTGRLTAIAAAVLTGQLSVGWSNDAVDGAIDLEAARRDKPIARGWVSRRLVAGCAIVGALACVPLSLRLGATAGVLHLVAVASALTYNAGVKRTLASPLPYVLSFGLLPVVTSYAVDGAARPSVLRVLAAALLGAAAHFGNTVPDADADQLTGVRGLPQRLGPRRSQQVVAGVMAVAAALLLAELSRANKGSAHPGGWASVSLLVAGVLVSAAALVLSGERGQRMAWLLTLLSVAMVVGGFLLGSA